MPLAVRILTPVAALALLAGACGDSMGTVDAASPDGSTTFVDAGPFEVETIAWEECPLILDAPTVEAPAAECATVMLPLDYSAPGGERIGIFVKRVLGTSSGSRKQLWLLHGGLSHAEDFVRWVADVAPRWSDVDFYMLDHRGSGRSARLTCPVAEDIDSELGRRVAEAEWPACIAHLEDTWGSDLQSFTMSNAARDVGTLIGALRDPAGQRFVYGVSYGGRWLARYMNLFPGQADAVIFDSPGTPSMTFDRADAWYDAVGDLLLARCAGVAECAARLGSDPSAFGHDVLDRIRAGHCSEAVAAFDSPERPGWRSVRLALTILTTAPTYREYVPALLYRLDRCSAGDVSTASLVLSRLLRAPTGESSTLSSPSAFNHVYLSEIWPEENPDCEALAMESDARLFASGYPAPMCRLFDSWPRHPRDDLAGTWPPADTPALMMFGGLDPQTPLAENHGLAEVLDGAHHYDVVFPTGPHALLARSIASDSEQPCGTRLVRQLLDDPTTAPDTACVDRLPTLTFASDPETNMAVFGRPDMWD